MNKSLLCLAALLIASPAFSGESRMHSTRDSGSYEATLRQAGIPLAGGLAWTSRTTVQTALDLDKQIRGTTAGFNTPIFVVDAPGGGGKRLAQSYEYYDRDTGISIYTSPAVDRDALYLYFDPLNALSAEMRANWQNPELRQQMIDEAIRRVRQST